MAFRKTISQDELAAKLTPEQRSSGHVYKASEGWYGQDDRPVAGEPNGTNGRLTRDNG
ncbi:hypothetical protein AB0N09_36020 [Streptomyces erythrochromogenes]|uniref:hypothetical protein n=1 Tax=Streptomyces erythrochromogenes TaxID=285574 RepID=UPI00342338B3